MIRLEKQGLWIKILTREWGFLEAVKEKFSGYANGYQFHPKYLAGVWDGKVFLLKDKKLPYGLLPDLLKFYKEEYSHIPLEIDPEVKAIFQTKDVDVDLGGMVFTAAFHQEQAIKVALKYRSGICRMATAGGKSFVMFAILKHLIKTNQLKKALIIVPNTLLVGQLHSNFTEEYGFDPSLVGKVYSKMKEWDKDIVISTWQSLMKNHDKLEMFSSVFVDEVQGAKAYQVSQILERLSNADIRLGFTGTLPDDEYDKWCIKSFLGPVLIDVTVDELQTQGWLSSSVIKMIQIHYKSFRKVFKIEDRDKKTPIAIANETNGLIFKHPFRLRTLRKYLDRIEKGAALLLVGKVETEGKFLKDYLEQYYPDRDIVFVSGGTKEKEREEWRQKCKDPNCKIILIATYPIFQAGVDIPALAHVFLVAPFKSKIRVLQSIGRALRNHISKVNGATIYDLVDMDDGSNERNSSIRLMYYEREKFVVEEITERDDE